MKPTDLLGSRVERIDRMSFADYKAAPAANKTLLNELDICPAQALDMLNAVESTPTTEMVIGSIVDSFITGQPFNDYHIKPATYVASDGTEKPWSGNAKVCKAWLATHADKPVLTLDELTDCQKMARCVFMHKHFRAVTTSGGVSQVSLFATHKKTGLQLKTRLDRLEPYEIVELKTTGDASTEAIQRTIVNQRYHVQMGIQKELCEQNGMEIQACWMVFVERGTGRVNIRRMKEEAVALGWWLASKQLEQLAECIKSDSWPDYSGADERPGVIDVPQWEYTRHEPPLALTTGGAAVNMD